MNRPCIECGEPTPEGKFEHPEWYNDAICEECHPGMWDEWIESKIQEYLDQVGSTGSYSDDLKDWAE